MNLQPTPREPLEVNITPLIDVVFLLLIFFMVSTTFDKESRIKVELPQSATQDEKVEEKDVLTITIDVSGRFYVNDREVINTEIGTLKAAMAKAAAERTDLPVIIKADAKTPYQSVITVMDAASQLGFVHMTFPTRQPSQEKK